MYCFYLMNKVTKEETFIYGYDLKKAMEKADMNPNDYEYLDRDYVDWKVHFYLLSLFSLSPGDSGVGQNAQIGK